MRTDEQRSNFPTKRANSAEVSTYNMLCASLYDLSQAAHKENSPVQKRLRMIPGGWRDMRMLYARMEGLLRDMWFTFEPEKRAQIRRMQTGMRNKLVVGPQACKDAGLFVLSEKDLGVLLFSATDRCKTCLGTPGECKRCQLGKTLDDVSFISRGDDRSWWEVMEAAPRAEGDEFE